jgi:hypothetical protein
MIEARILVAKQGCRSAPGTAIRRHRNFPGRYQDFRYALEEAV